MADDRELEQAFEALLPEMQRCAARVEAGARGREKKRARVLDALLAEAGAYVRGVRGEPAFGLGDQVADLASMGRAPSSRKMAAISALASYAYALEAAWDLAAGRGSLESVHEALGHARAHAAESEGIAPAKPQIEDVAARVQRLAPGDDQELAAVVADIVELRRVDLVEPVLERLGLVDDADVIQHAMRVLARLLPPAKFAALCARLCASPNAGTRRWVARALISGLRPEHVPALLPLLRDPEPKVRREAATVLRAGAIWHPGTRASIVAATAAALAALPGEPSLVELRGSLSAPPPTTS